MSSEPNQLGLQEDPKGSSEYPISGNNVDELHS